MITAKEALILTENYKKSIEIEKRNNTCKIIETIIEPEIKKQCSYGFYYALISKKYFRNIDFKTLEIILRKQNGYRVTEETDYIAIKWS